MTSDIWFQFFLSPVVFLPNLIMAIVTEDVEEEEELG